MSEREVVTQSGQVTALSREKVEEHMKQMTKEERRAVIARVQSRGIIIDATTVENLPSNLHGEWVHRNPIDIARMEALGFWVDTEYAHSRAMHSDGSGSTGIVGDTIYMVTTRENKELIDEIRHEEYVKMHGKITAEGVIENQKEEKDYRTQVEKSGIPTPVIEESQARTLQKAELETVLKGGS